MHKFDVDSVNTHLLQQHVEFQNIYIWTVSSYLPFSFGTPIQENFIYKKQGPSPISLVRATRIFSEAKTLKKNFDLSLAIGGNPIYPF